MFAYEFEMAGTTVTMAITDHSEPNNSKVLVGWRSDDSDAYPGAPCLPGGFLDVPETSKAAASRETKEETNLDISEDRWYIFYVDDKPGSDPRYKQVVNMCYMVEVAPEETSQAKAGDDLKELKWVPYNDLIHMDLAFSHNDIVEELRYHI